MKIALSIPEDLTFFLRKRKQLVYNPKKAIAGSIKLMPLHRLRIGRVYAAPKSTADPNRRRSGVYRIPAISITSKAEQSDPEHLLTYLPFEGLYATFDGDHAVVTVFSEATWSDIAADPLPYLNANWEKKPSVKATRRTQWFQRYVFFDEAFE